MIVLSEISPLLIVTAALIIIFMVILIRRNLKLIAFIAFAGLLLAFFSLLTYPRSVHYTIAKLLSIDGYSLFFMGLIFIASMATTVLSYRFLLELKAERDEYYILLLLAVLGSSILVVSVHLVSFFLGLEILSVSLYGMIAYTQHEDRSIEAGIKYLILAATSSAFLLFGIALIYAESGTMQFGNFAANAESYAGDRNLFRMGGFGLMMVGIGFKLGVVPFHMWTPDVYEGAPAPVTGFLAAVSKGAMFALLFRYFGTVHFEKFPSLVILFGLVSVASMFLGNLLALQQKNVKRILAYSSIAHIGYLLVAFIAGGPLAITTLMFYLAAYFITILCAFGIVSVLSRGQAESNSLAEYRGLFWSRPWAAVLFTTSLLSLAGIPLTAGFIAKYFVIAAGVGTSQRILVAVMVVNSTIALFYYLRIIVVLYTRTEIAENHIQRMLYAERIIFALLLFGLIWLGVYPASFLDLIQSLLKSMFI